MIILLKVISSKKDCTKNVFFDL